MIHRGCWRWSAGRAAYRSTSPRRDLPVGDGTTAGTYELRKINTSMASDASPLSRPPRYLSRRGVNESTRLLRTFDDLRARAIRSRLVKIRPYRCLGTF